MTAPEAGAAGGAVAAASAPIDRMTGQPSLRTLAMPADTNPNGDIFGGWILAQMDIGGGTFAYHVARGRVATVAVTAMKFHKPVAVGDEVSIWCRTERIGTTSITVRVEAWVRRRRLAREEQVTEGLFTFVAIDERGRPCPVPGAGTDAGAPTGGAAPGGDGTSGGGTRGGGTNGDGVGGGGTGGGGANR